MREISIEKLLEEAFALAQSGANSRAEALYSQILNRDPRQAEALNMLGLLLQNRAEIRSSIDLLSRAIEIDPTYADAHVNLARALRAQGDLKAAQEHASKASTLDPELPEAFALLGRLNLDLDDPQAALSASQTAIKLQPDLADAHINAGNALRRLENYPSAIQAFLAALRLNPSDMQSAISLAICFGELNLYDDAITWHHKALELDSTIASSWFNLAIAYSRAQQIPSAIDACKRALDLDSGRAQYWTLLGSLTASLGNFEEAELHHRKALDINPHLVEAKRELVSIRKFAGDTNELQLLFATLKNTNTPVTERISAGFALGSELDKLNDYEGAFEAFAFANKLSRGLLEVQGKAFNRQEFADSIDWLIKHFTRGSIAAMMQWGTPSDLPVFVVGMPRSGTTLVEQIASSHPLVVGGGERKDVPRILDIISGGTMNTIPMYWDRLRLFEEAKAYLMRLHALDPSAIRAIDKLPDNVQALGQISIMFPRAKVILCRRDLRDVCLSCFTQRFAEGMSWTNDLSDLAFRARGIGKLVRHWKAVVPLPILEVAYEDMVSDLEGESRRLIDFLGLPWDDNCLKFYENKRSVMTASRWQVRQPIYTGSVGRWRHYEAFLGPLLSGLCEPCDDPPQQAWTP